MIFYFGTINKGSGHVLYPIDKEIDRLSRSQLSRELDSDRIHMLFACSKLTVVHFSDFTIIGIRRSIHDDRGGCISLVGCSGNHSEQDMKALIKRDTCVYNIFCKLGVRYGFNV